MATGTRIGHGKKIYGRDDLVQVYLRIGIGKQCVQ